MCSSGLRVTENGLGLKLNFVSYSANEMLMEKFLQLSYQGPEYHMNTPKINTAYTTNFRTMIKLQDYQ